MPLAWLPIIPLVLCTVAPSAVASIADLDTARKQFLQICLKDNPADLKEAADFAAQLRADGSWPDVDYASKDRSSWPTADHVERIVVMTKALRDPSASPTQRESLARAVHGALAYWRQHDYKCPNWFHNRIGLPRKLCEIALVLDEQHQPEELDYLANTVVPRSKVGSSTGQNRVWLAGINLMYGLIQGNEETVATAASTIFAEAVVAGPRKEGIQSDSAFHQHGPQLQMGNYGLSFADDQVRWMTILRGTPWAASASQMEVIRRYLLEGQNWVAWRGAMDVSCCGRAFAPGAQASRARKLASVMSAMSALDPAGKSDYEAFVKRNQPNGVNDLIGCRHFWCTDYLVHRRKDFCVTLKMCSNRVTGSESLNGQNLSGYHLADGATYIYRTGDEYKDIFPVWNWRMLPGVTCAQHGPMPKFGSYRLKVDFVGGVTDGQNGCAVLDYSRDGVSAKKSWFFGGDQVVCLGSAVKASTDVKSPIMTTINQCLLRGKVRVGDGKIAYDLQSGAHSLSDVQWIEHDGIRYTLPKGQNIILCNQKRTGNWSIVAKTPAMPKEDVSESVFDLAIVHGSQPVDGSYAYGISPAAVREPFEILSNTDKLQAVRFGDGLTEAVFHAPGRLDYATGRSVAVDSPCLVMIDTSGSAVRVTVADPTHKLKSLGIEIDGKKRDIQLPQGQEAGKSVAVR